MPDAYRNAILDSPVGPTARIVDWSLDEHLKTKDRFGIETTVLSLAPPGLWFGDLARTKAAARACNEELADVVRRGGGRFRALATLPLPDPAATCEEIAYALDVLKLDGVAFFASYGGQYLGRAEFEPVLSALNQRRSVALIHPNIHPANKHIELDLPGFVMEYPFDTTRAAVNLILSGATERFPEIRYILAHAGGVLPYLAYRLALVGAHQLATPEFAERYPLPFFARPEATDPEFFLSHVRRFWFEIALSAGPATLAALKNFAAPDHILFGTDWPYAPDSILADTLTQMAANPTLDDADRRAIAFDNGQQMFAAPNK